MPGVTFGELVMIITSSLVMIFDGFDLDIVKTKMLVQFYGLCLILTLFSFLLQQHEFIAIPTFEVFSRWLRYFAYVVFIIISGDKLDVNYALKIYLFMCVCVSIYIIMQTLAYYVYNIALPIKILPLSFSRESDMYVLFSSFDKYYYRAYGPFAEPGYAAKFLLPGLAISLYDSLVSHKKIALVMLISAGIILTTSLQGVILVFFSYLYFVYYLMSHKKKFRILIKPGKIFVIILSVSVLASVFYSLGIFDSPIERISSISAVSQGGSLAYSSIGMRVYRGFALFSELSILYKIIGVGMGNLGNFVIENDVYTKFDYFFTTIDQIEYVNAISGLLLSSGIIGAFYFIKYFCSLYRNTENPYTLIFLQFTLLLFGGGGFFSMTTVLYLSLVYIGYKNGCDRQ